MSSLMWRRGAVLAFAAAFAMPAWAAPDLINPCSLASVAEVTVAVGVPVEPGQMVDNGVNESGARSTICLWATPVEEGQRVDRSRRFGGRGFVLVNLIQWPGGAAQARSFLAEFDRAFEKREIDTKPVPVDVGGDEAIWWGDGVAARKGAASVGISVAQFGDQAERKPQAERIARFVVARLP